MRNGIAIQSEKPTPSEARDKAQGQARRQRACGVKGQSPLRSLRQSLNRRKPTSGADRQKKNVNVGQKTKRCRSGILCTAFCVLFYRVKSAKSDSDFAAVECGTKKPSEQIGELLVILPL